MEQITSIVARATSYQEGLSGFFRVSAFKRKTAISGICGQFTASPGFKDVKFNSKLEELFFYGNEKDFRPNYPSESEAEKKMPLFDVMLKSPYSRNTIHRENMAGYSEIPLGQLELSQEWYALLGHALEDCLLWAKQFPKKMKRIEMPSKDNMAVRRATISQFKKFPDTLLELADKSGHYFTFNERKSVNYVNQVITQLSASQIPKSKIQRFKTARKSDLI